MPCISEWQQFKIENLCDRWAAPTRFDRVTWFRSRLCKIGLDWQLNTQEVSISRCALQFVGQRFSLLSDSSSRSSSPSFHLRFGSFLDEVGTGNMLSIRSIISRHGISVFVGVIKIVTETMFRKHKKKVLCSDGIGWISKKHGHFQTPCPWCRLTIRLVFRSHSGRASSSFYSQSFAPGIGSPVGCNDQRP